MNCYDNIEMDNIQKRLKHDLKVIVDELLLSLPQYPIAIYLCGGYGRDEGAWFCDSKGNIHPYNDYDLSIITDYPLEYEKLQSLRRKLAEMLKIQWIDIDFYSSDYNCCFSYIYCKLLSR